MKAIWFPLATLFALAAGATAHASTVSDKLGVILPYTGTYYDPNQSGSGLTVDVGPGGLLFIVFETYDQAGNQVNLIAQPIYVPSGEAALESGGTIGSVTTSFYQAANGQCPGCAYRAPTLTVSPVTANFVWASPRHVTMTFGSHIYHFGAVNFESKDDEEFLPGTWTLSFVNDNSVYPGEGPEYQITLPTELAVMRIAPAAFTTAQMTLDPASSSDVTLPPANAHLYTLQCAGNQMGVDDTACNTTELIWTNVVRGSQSNPIPLGTAKAMIWYDTATATAGMDIYQQAANGSVVIGPADFHGELYVTPSTLQVHLQAQGPPGVAAVTDGIEGIALTFTRLPPSAVRDCYDYVSSRPCQ